MFRTLTPPRKKKITITALLSILTRISLVSVLLMYVAALIPQFFRYKDVILETSFSVVIVAAVLFLLTGFSYIFLKSKRGKFTGEMNLTEHELMLNGNGYQVSEIEKVRFIGNDIVGEFRGYQSKGTQNEVILKLKNGTEIRSAFEHTA